MLRPLPSPCPPWFAIAGITALVCTTGYSKLIGFAPTFDHASLPPVERLVELVAEKAETIRLTSSDAAHRLGLKIFEIRPSTNVPLDDQAAPTAMLVPSPTAKKRVVAAYASSRRATENSSETSAQVAPATADSIAIPVTALVEDGKSVSIFLAQESRPQEFQRVRVNVLHVRAGKAYLARQLAGDDGADSMRMGDRIVVSGAVALAGEMLNLRLNSRR